jgi:hypothetical protein
MAGARGAELDRRDARLEEGDGVGGAVAAHGHRLGLPRGLRDGLGEPEHVGVRARDVGGREHEGAPDLHVVDRPDLREELIGILVGQVADVDVHDALVGNLVDRVPAGDPAEVDRGPVEQLGGLARERQGLDSPEDVDRLQHGVVPQPRGRGVGGAAVDGDPAREDALGLDADAQVGRLAGDREVAGEPAPDHLVAGAALDVLGLLVGHAQEADADLVLGGQVVHREHHRREAALHVVGTAPEQAVAVDARRELLRAAGHDVEVAVEDQRGRVGGADLGRQHVEIVERVVGDRDVARVEPALDEAGRRAQPVHRRRVVGDQSLGQHPFVHGRAG